MSRPQTNLFKGKVGLVPNHVPVPPLLHPPQNVLTTSRCLVQRCPLVKTKKFTGLTHITWKVSRNLVSTWILPNHGGLRVIQATPMKEIIPGHGASSGKESPEPSRQKASEGQFSTEPNPTTNPSGEPVWIDTLLEAAFSPLSPGYPWVEEIQEK